MLRNYGEDFFPLSITGDAVLHGWSSGPHRGGTGKYAVGIFDDEIRLGGIQRARCQLTGLLSLSWFFVFFPGVRRWKGILMRCDGLIFCLHLFISTFLVEGNVQGILRAKFKVPIYIYILWVWANSFIFSLINVLY